ncbi:hypothetical protein, partial [Stenotrophomonas maltophilia]|uniref:hypothetical protein n=1 Tax=Stenotrophomonas maltophilia TaxID=40324 RepID=UPI001A7E0B2B
TLGFRAQRGLHRGLDEEQPSTGSALRERGGERHAVVEPSPRSAFARSAGFIAVWTKSSRAPARLCGSAEVNDTPL